MKLRALIVTIFLMGHTASAWGAAAVTLSSTATSVVAGTPITLTATVSGVPSIGQVVFYNGTTILGSSAAPTTPGGNIYTFTWTPTAGAYSISALVYDASGSLSPTGVSSMVMDTVGNSSLTSNSTFGEQNFSGTGATSWLEGDNQMCSVNGVPYNGATTAYPDGSCEWMNEANINGVTNSSSPSLNPTTETIDGLDDAMHTLSDFVTYSNSLLALGPGTLNSTLNNWSSQVAEWIGPGCGTTCSLPPCGNTCTSTAFDEQLCGDSDTTGKIPFCNKGGQNGRLLNIYNPPMPGSTTPLKDLFGDWNKNVITPWLNTIYTSSNAWCLPPATGVGVSPGYNEYAYIASNSNSSTTWGDLPHVIACLNYNANPYSAGTGNSAINAYQSCLNFLTSGTCPATITNTVCSPLVLGRTLLNAASEPQPAFPGSGALSTNRCNVNYSGSYAHWVQDSLTLAQDEAPKFTLRSEFLSDLYTRAQTMQTSFNAIHLALGNFFKTCTGCGDGSSCSGNRCADGSECDVNATTTCQDGGPVQQLQRASSTTNQALILPNAVIYGWVDNTYPNGMPGYAHIVKVTAYSPGRQGTGGAHASFILSLLPWIDTWETITQRIYELTARDGYVYVSVKRWDEEHNTTPLTFPNKHALWTFLFSSNNSGLTTAGTKGLISQCNSPTTGYPYGLVPETVAALQHAMTPPTGGVAAAATSDQVALQNAFMLNDRGDGIVDPTFNGAPAPGGYMSCLSQANQLLALGIESHACAEYIAASPGSDSAGVQSGSSSSGDSDYSIKFVDCSKIAGYQAGPPDDLVYQGS